GGRRGRLSFSVRALHPDLSLRHAARGRLPETYNPRRSDRRVHAHDTGGRVPRRGAPGGHLPPGADGAPVRGRDGYGSSERPLSVFTGTHSHGQGHETTFAQVASDELQLPIEDIEIVHGDTGQVPFGMGSYGSRSAAVGATALYMGTQKIKEKAKKIAAHLLEANEADVVYEGGKFSVKGSPARFKTFGDIALMAY